MQTNGYHTEFYPLNTLTQWLRGASHRLSTALRSQLILSLLTLASLGVAGTAQATCGAISTTPVSPETCTATAVGSSSTCQFNVKEAGTNTCAIGTGTVAFTDTAEWSLVSNGCTGTNLSSDVGSGPCTIVAKFQPTSAGAKTSTVTLSSATVNTSIVMNATATSPQCTFALTASSACGTSPYLTSKACPGLTLTSTGTSCSSTVSAPTVGAGFSVASTCAATVGPGSCTITPTYLANSTSASSGTVTVVTGNGSPTASVTGSPTFGTATVSSVTCSSTGSGTSIACTPTITVTASGGPIILGSTLSVASGSTSNFTSATSSSGACTAGQTLATSASCNLVTFSSFQPTTVGSETETFTVTPANGTAGSGTVSGTGTAGVISFTASACGTYPLSASPLSIGCPALTLTATGGPVTFSASPITNSNATEFSYTTTCASAALPVNGTCTITPTFTPGNNGGNAGSATLNLTVGTGGGATALANGIGRFGNLTATPSTLACGTSSVGTQLNCSTVITITSDGNASMSTTTNNQFVLGGTNPSDFNIANGTCFAGASLSATTSCTTGTINFLPAASGARTATVTVNKATGQGTGTTFTLTGTGNSFATASVASLACGSRGVGTSGACGAGSLTITANSGNVTFGSTPFSNTDSTDFTVSGCAGVTLTIGQTCTATVIFNPTSAGAFSDTVSVNPTSGGGTSFSLSGTGINGALSASGSVSCATVNVGSSSTCSGSITLSASGGPVTLSASPFSNSDSTDFTVGLGTCTANLAIASGSSCTTGTITFNPTSSGLKSDTVTVAASAGTGTSFALSGTAQAFLTASPTSLSCSATQGVNSTGTCGTVTLTANGGSITLGTTPFLSSDAEFTEALGTCTANKVLTAGGTCTTGQLSFTPTSSGAKSTTVTVSSGVANLTYTASGTGVYGSLAASPTSLACGSLAAGSSAACSTGTITLTASGGPVILSATPFSATDSTDFTAPLGTCTASSTIASGSSCTTGTISFNPATLGSKTDTLTVATSNGTGASFTLSGTGTAAVATLTSTASLAFGSVAYDTSTLGQYTNTVTYQNTGNIAMTLGSPTLTAPLSVIANTCTAIAANASCTMTIQLWANVAGLSQSATFVPTGASNSPATVTLTWSVTEINSQWTSSPSFPTLAFGNVAVGASSTLPLALFNEGNVAVNWASTVLGNLPAGFTADLSACSSVAANGGSCSVNFTFSPTTAAAYFGSGVTPNQRNANVNSLTLSGTGVYGSLTASPTSLTCANIGVGSSTTCSTGTITLTASDGPVTLSATPFSASDSADFTVPLGTCTASAVLTTGASCTTGTISFNPATAASLTDTVTVSAAAGTGTSFTLSGNGYSYTWTPGSWSASSSTCDATATQTRSVSCIRSDGTTVANSFCSGTEPATSQIVADFSTCTFAWTQSGFGVCSGGTGTWNYSSWSPTAGCGAAIPQSRTATCVADTNSVTQTQTVLCQRSDGTTVANSNCTTSEPATSQTCTPTLDFSCGVEGSLSQTFSDTSLCGYSWTTGAWGSDSSTCSINDIQTRAVSCTQSDGTTVAASLCTAGGAGVQPAATQTVANYSSCTYSWLSSSYGSCTGGTGTWNYTSWAPTTGCGASLTQTRSGICGADSLSSTHTRTVSCLQSDGQTVDASLCSGAGTEPATSASCTPTSGFSCGTEGVLSQPFSDFSTCSFSWQSNAWSAPSSTCSATATETRTNSCVRSDGTTVDGSNCTASAPATSQVVPTFSSCTFAWIGSGFGSCSGGTGTWNYSSWSPAIGCGITAQTRTGTCVADPNSSVQTQTLSCQRSDGTTVDNSNCTGTAPASSQACTPTDSFSCGTEASLTQSMALTSSCTYSWSTGPWSADSSTCSTAATETRSVTCTQSDGTTVDNSLCSGVGTQPATSQTVSDLSGCTFSWTASAYGDCTGGAGVWDYSSWAPSTGCGTGLTQTRTGSCVVTANSGTETRQVACTRSDGTSVDASNCTGSAPAAFAACTPTSGFSCGTEGSLSQSFDDTSLCGYAWSAGAWSAPSSTCSDGASETRAVTCTQSDGATVANSFCVDAGTAPTTSQSVSVYSGCGTATLSASSVTCAATGVGTGSLNCSPDTITVTATGGPITLGAPAFTNSDIADFSVTSTCAANALLAQNASCTLTIDSTPSLISTTGAIVTINTQGSLGTGGSSFSIAGSGSAGFAVASAASISCGSVGEGSSGSCGTETITATAGPITLGALTGATSDLILSGNTCLAGITLNAGNSCQMSVNFAPTVLGAESTLFTLATTSGAGTSFTATGTGAYGIAQASPTSIACGTETVGQTTLCGVGNVTITASGGPIVFNGNPFSLNDNTDFTVASGTCLNASLALGQTCTTGAISFTPASDGAKAVTVTITPAFGTSSPFTLSGTGTFGFSWNAAGFGSCTGGTGTWSYTSWTPTTGCGLTAQSRTGNCAVTALSGTQTQVVTCLRSDGTVVANSNCTGTAPATSAACTPTTGFSCGAEGALTQAVSLSNGCDFSWNAGAFGSCTGGTSSWVYTSWTPAVGSACTSALNETRSGTCTATANSGSATRNVTCQDQNGNVVAMNNCTGTAPAASESCTPTPGSCGTQGALIQTVSDFSTCSYSWHASGFGSCSGGTGAWAYSSWTPTCGIGPTMQTRTGTCAGTANSGQQSQVVTCIRTDGTVVANSFCTGTAPASSAPCSPTTGFSCGTEGMLTQRVTLTNKCTTQSTCVVSPTNTCATTP